MLEHGRAQALPFPSSQSARPTAAYHTHAGEPHQGVNTLSRHARARPSESKVHTAPIRVGIYRAQRRNGMNALHDLRSDVGTRTSTSRALYTMRILSSIEQCLTMNKCKAGHSV